MADPNPRPPSVLALPLDRARACLAAAGWSVLTVMETTARERPAPTEAPRVVRQIVRGQAVELTVARAAVPTWLRAETDAD